MDYDDCITFRSPLGEKTGDINYLTSSYLMPDVILCTPQDTLRVSPQRTPRSTKPSTPTSQITASDHTLPTPALDPLFGVECFSASFHIVHPREPATWERLSRPLSSMINSRASTPAMDASIHSHVQESDVPQTPTSFASHRRSLSVEPWAASFRLQVLTPDLASQSEASFCPDRRPSVANSRRPRRSMSPISMSLYSRSGARAPEPADLEWDGMIGWGCMGPRVHTARVPPRDIRAVMRWKLRSFTERLRSLRRREARASVTFESAEMVDEYEDGAEAAWTPRPSQAELWGDATSTRSAGSSALRMWLDDRRRASMESNTSEASSMSLEAYDQTGSWLELALPVHDEDGTEWFCGIPHCGVQEHATTPNRLPSSPMLVQAQRTNLPFRATSPCYASSI